MLSKHERNTTTAGSISPLVVVNDIRPCRREVHDGYGGIANDMDNDNDNSSNSDGDRMARKKIRLPEDMETAQVVSPATTGDDSEDTEEKEQPTASPPRQWWFSRHSLPTPLAGAGANSTTSNVSRSRNPNDSGMVLSEHLGKASDVVESLTHDVKNWSLTRLSTTASATSTSSNNRNNSTGSNIHMNANRKKEKQKKSKDAQRQVRMARRRCLEAQTRLGSSTNPAAMD